MKHKGQARLVLFILIVLAGLNESAPAQSKKVKSRDYIERLDGSKLSFTAIDKMVSEVMMEARVTGLQLAVFNDSIPKYMQSYGFRDAAKSSAINNNTVLQAASLSKSMFACIVLKLVEEGRFDLDKPVYQYLDFPLYELTNFRFDYKDLEGDDRHKKITGRMLLAHTAGFRNYRFFGNDHNRLLIHFEPGTQYHYSGEGIILLQSIVEIATREDLVTLSERYLFEPLGMDRTSYVWDEAFIDNVAIGFDKNENGYELEKRGTASAAASAVTTVADFSKLLVAILNKDLLRDDLRKAMITPQHRIMTKTQFGPNAFVIDKNNTHDDIELSYGLGWCVLKSPYGYGFIKEGNDRGFQHYSILFENGKGLVLMTNSDNGDRIFQYLNEHIIGNTYTPWDWEMIVPYTVRTIGEILTEMFEDKQGIAKVVRQYNRLRQDLTGDPYYEYIFNEGELNRLGYALLRENRIADAIEIFKTNTISFPQSSNVYDSLGEAYMKNNDIQPALFNYRKSLELNPNNGNARKMIKELERREGSKDL